MLKNLPLILLIQVAYATKVNIANCNELWGMTNTMNKQPLYSVKIFSCVVNPTFSNNQIEIIDSNDTTVGNNTNISTITNPLPNSTDIVSIPTPSPSSNDSLDIHTPSPSSSVSLDINIPSPSSSFYLRASIPSPSSSSYLRASIPSPSSNDGLRDTSPSSKIDTNNDNIDESDNINQIDLIELGINSPSSSSSMSNKSAIDSDSLDVGIIIAIIISSCVVVGISILGILKYKQNKLNNNVRPAKSLKSSIKIAKPHMLNTSHMSSKTDETSPRSPHPPLPNSEPIIEKKPLPNLPPSNDEIIESDNVESNSIMDLESGKKTPIKPENK